MVETVLLYCQFHFFSKQVSNNGLLDQGDLEARSVDIICFLCPKAKCKNF